MSMHFQSVNLSPGVHLIHKHTSRTLPIDQSRPRCASKGLDIHMAIEAMDLIIVPGPSGLGFIELF
jgi:hypothetical protein